MQQHSQSAYEKIKLLDSKLIETNAMNSHLKKQVESLVKTEKDIRDENMLLRDNKDFLHFVICDNESKYPKISKFFGWNTKFCKKLAQYQLSKLYPQNEKKTIVTKTRDNSLASIH